MLARSFKMAAEESRRVAAVDSMQEAAMEFVECHY